VLSEVDKFVTAKAAINVPSNVMLKPAPPEKYGPANYIWVDAADGTSLRPEGGVAWVIKSPDTTTGATVNAPGTTSTP